MHRWKICRTYTIHNVSSRKETMVGYSEARMYTIPCGGWRPYNQSSTTLLLILFYESNEVRSCKIYD
jgi:hypothetical protein